MTFYYLATPYTAHPGGLEIAYTQACEQAAFLISHGIPAFSPIVHSHPIATIGGLPHCDHDLWLRIDEHYMNGARAMIWCELAGHNKSHGMAWESSKFTAHNKRVITMRPWTVPRSIQVLQ